jgi:plastocyanin
MRDEKQHRRVIGLTLALTIAAGMALIGCQTQHEAPSTSAPPAGTEAAVGSTQPITLTWDQQSSCVNFSQGTITIKVGDKIRFNSSVGQTVTLRVSTSAFGANDTTMVISANGSYTTARAATPGSYNVNSAPAMCSPGGGVGPTIVIEETK